MEANLLSFNNKSSVLIVYFARDSVQFFNPKTRVMEVEALPAGLIKDLEITDKNALAVFFKSCLQKHKLAVASALIVLSPQVFFETTLKSSGDEQESEIRKFLDTIPFEAIRSKTYAQSETSTLIAVNKNLCEALVQALEQNDIGTIAVIPSSIIPPLVEKPMPGVEAADYILKNIASLKLQTITQTFEINDTPRDELAPLQTPRNTRAYILGGVFTICIVILVVVLLTRK
ncbi:MAG: hypothetical protein Q7S79_03870 [bacterium]|nr:hypothetical protein [bacterium]